MKKFLALVMVAVLVLSLAACKPKEVVPQEPAPSDNSSTPAPAQPEDKKVKLIFSVNAVPGDAHYEAMMKFEEVVEAKSNGSIEVETYHSGSLFKQDQELAAVKSGQADIVYLSAPWLTEGSPWISMFNAGYMFKSYDHMTKALNGEVGQEVFERVAKETRSSSS